MHQGEENDAFRKLINDELMKLLKQAHVTCIERIAMVINTDKGFFTYIIDHDGHSKLLK